MPQHHKINYLEFQVSDLDASKAFFARVFDWKFVDYGPDYASFLNAGIDGGLMRGELASRSDNGAALTIFYSDDLEASEAAVQAAGGEILRPIFAFPGGRRFHFSEPSGNEFAIWGEI